MHRNADSETHDDEDEELPPPLDIPLFAVEKVLAVRPRSKDASAEVRRRSSTSSPISGVAARASGDPASDAFAGEDDASDAAGRAPHAREGRRELVAAACTSEAAARLGDPPATRVFYAAAHASDEGTRHHLLLRAERVASEGGAEGAGASGARDTGARALPWYEGEQARITSLEFSPICCSEDAGDGPLLLCGTRGGGVYVIPAGAALDDVDKDEDEDEDEDENENENENENEDEPAAAPAVRVLCTAGPPIVSVLWWRKREHDDAKEAPSSSSGGASSLVAVACASNGEIRFWSARGAPLCAVFTGGPAHAAAVVDAGADLGQFLLISGERASVMAARRTAMGASAGSSRGAPDEDAPKAHWTLALERGGDSLPAAAGKRGFAPALVEGRFGAPPASEAEALWSRAALSVHVGAHDGARPDGARTGRAPGGDASPLASSLVARLSAAAETLALFHPANDRDAVATYRVPPGTIDVRVTRRLIFALHRRSGGRARLSALVREDEAASRGPDGVPADADPDPERRGDGTGPDQPSFGTRGADPAAGAGAGAGATSLRPVWRYLEIVPVVIQELTLSSGVGRPLARALMPCGDRRGEEGRRAVALEGCAVAAQGATLACRPATPSSETLVRGLLGTAEGAEAEAFARAARRAAGKDGARRRAPTTRRGGDAEADAETLLRALGTPRARRAVLYTEAMERAASVGDVPRAARLASKAAPRAATALCVAACLGEWRAADALDHLDRANRAAASPGDGADRAANGTRADETRGTRSRADRPESEDDADDADEADEADEAWLRLCCAAHLELSAWAAAAAAAAIGAAGEMAEEIPGVSAAFPWPSGALSPPLAADAADALARSAAATAPTHRSLGSLQAAARAARLAADAAAGITAFVRASARASARGDDGAARAARRDATSTIRVMLAAGSAADTLHRGGEALRRFVAYAPPTGGLGGPLEEEEEDDEEAEGAARSPAAAARAVAAAARARGGSRSEPWGRRSDSSAIVAVLPLMRTEEIAELAASASGSGAAEIRVAALLSLAARRGGGAAEARWRLERELRQGLAAGTVRPGWAIAATTGFDNPSAAAIALASAGDWVAATRHRLRAVEDAFPADAGPERSEASASSAQAALASTLAEYASRAATAAARASALAAVARAWRARGLSGEALESLLLADTDAVGAEALAALLRGEGATRGDVGVERRDASDAPRADDGRNGTGTGTARSDPFPFSASFALRVASLRVRVASRAAARADARDDARDDDGASWTEHASAAGKDENGSRWSRVRRALCADEAKATAVYFSAHVAREMHPDEDGVAFTCGHVVSDAALRASAAALAEAWRDEGCPMSGDLVAAEYAKRRIALACPACVGAAVRKDTVRGD